MTPVEIIAFLFAVGVLAKAIIIPFVNKKWLMKFVKKMFSNKLALNILFTVLAVILGYYLLLELTIIQIMASSLFGLMIAALIAAAYPKGYLKLAEEVLKDTKSSWYVFLVYIALSIWILYALFA